MIHKTTFISILFFAVGCAGTRESGEDWRSLFNGDNLEGWDTYLGPEYDPEKGDFSGDPFGLNNDPDKVFSVVKSDGQGALRISGEHFGGISTKEEFSNYHFQLQFKWGQAKYAPRDSARRDSGLLYHATGPHGVDWFFWMKSQEFQVQEGDCGDYWGLGSDVNIPVIINEDSTYVYNREGILLPFGAHSPYSRNVKKYPDAEKPSGEWNTLDLYSLGDTSVHVVNGMVTMVLFNSRQPRNGQEIPLTKGKLQIQSEGAEIFYRNLKIRSIQKFPGFVRF